MKTRIALLLLASSLSGETTGSLPPLALAELLESTWEAHPSMRQAGATLEEARARELSARGAFDPQLSLRARTEAAGYYPSRALDARVAQPTRLWGTELQAGYRLGRGEFAPYEGNLATAGSGEWFAGVRVPLLQGGATDPARIELTRSGIQTSVSEADRERVRLELTTRAAGVYFRWLAAIELAAIRQRILDIARDRDRQIRGRVAAGDLPAVTLNDNQRLILQRQQDVIRARQELRETELELSLYWRDSRGEPRPPEGREPLRPDWARLASQHVEPESQGAASGAEPGRPEMRVLEFSLEALTLERGLRRNLLLPRLDFSLETSQGLGAGPERLQATEVKGAVFFSMPLFFRGERGAVLGNEAAIVRAEAQQVWTREQIFTEVAVARSRVTARQEEWKLATEETRLARQLEGVEQRAFSLGHSNLIDVNIREEASASAATRVVEAEASLALAWARFLASRGIWDIVPVLY